MVDLNLWRLEYDDVTIDFGTHESGYPLTKQVSVGVVAAEYGDQPHPMTNGVVPGVDRTRGRVYSFAGAHLTPGPLAVADADKWGHALDLSDVLEAAWAAEQVAAVEGAVATLTNVDRGRTLFGRPRNYAPTLDRVRKGWSEWAAEFHTVDRRAYGPERAVAVTTVAGQVGGISTPLTAPVTTSSLTDTRARIDSVGTLDAWPVITISPGCLNPRLDMLDAAGGLLWRVAIDGTVPEAQPVVIDTRPWSRGVTIGGSPADGRLRGDQLETCRIRPGQSEARFYATVNPGGAVAATVVWRDAHSSL